jgi:hypothetical protein
LKEHPGALTICRQCVPEGSQCGGLAGTPEEIREEMRKAEPNYWRNRN